MNNKVSSVLFVKALYDFDSKDTSSLSFKKNDIIQVLTQLESGWWDGLCNGERGWFPSNYVITLDSLDSQSEILDEDDELFGWILQQTPDGNVFYYNVKTGESSWELPMDDSEFTHTARNTISSINSFTKQLPENWIQKPTEDGNTYYYYNVITKEVRWTCPGSSILTDISSDTDNEEIDTHVTALVEDDLEGVDTDKASIASSKGSQLSTASNDTIQQRSLQQRQSIGNLPPNWIVKTTPRGKVYYYNKFTNEITRSLDNINADGQLIRTENDGIDGMSGLDDEEINEPFPPTPTSAVPHTPKRFSEPSIFMLQNASENLNWDSLSQSIDSSIHNLNLAIQEHIRQDYADCTSAIVESVRIMLYASGTIEKDSVIIKQNKDLKNYHRSIMASLSKLVLSTKAAASIWPPPDSTQRMKSDADEVLDAVHKFIQTAQQTVDIRRVDPRIIKSATSCSWHGNSLIQIQPDDNKSISPSISSSVNSEDTLNSPTSLNNQSHYLTPDLINLLDRTSRNATQSIGLLLNYVRKVIDTPNSYIAGTFSPQLISQTREILTQVGLFLSIIENINLKDLNESSFATINEFNVAKQALYNNIAVLVICIQTTTDPLSSLNAMDQILVCANMVDKSVKYVIITIKSLVDGRIQGTRSRRPSAVESEYSRRPSAVESENSRRPSAVESEYSRRPSAVESEYSRRPSAVESENSRRPSAVESENSTRTLIDGNDFVEDQPMTPMIPSDITNPSASKSLASLETVPENEIMENSIIIGAEINSINSSNDDVPTSPSSTSGQSFASTSRLQRSYSNASSATLADSSQIANGSNTGGTKLRSKVTKFFGEDISPNVTQSQKQKEDKPLFLNYDYDPSEMVFNMESSVKGGTLNALVERLTMHDLLDSNFIATYLLTYRSFCSTDDLFDMLVKRFMIQPPENITPEELEVWQEKKQTPVRLRVFNIIKTWLEFYYIDDEDIHCLERMMEFAKTTMHEHLAFAAVSLTKVIEKRQQQRKDAKFKELIMTNSSAPPAPILPKNIRKLRFLDIDPLEIARQLTIIESKLYNKIQPVECLGKAWSQSNSEAVNIKAMIVNSNKITGWVAESVLNQKEIRKRCLYIKHFVAVADKCRCLNNFNSLTAITSGLYSAPIHRLKRTWELVNAKTAQTLESLNRIMNSTKNFAEYREMLHSINPPCVPFFGLYLTDLTFIEDGNPDFLKNSSQLINFSKRMKTADVIREIQQYQSVPYNLNQVQEIQMFIQCHLQDSRDVKDLYEQSLLLEPREREDEKIARLLQESGFL